VSAPEVAATPRQLQFRSMLARRYIIPALLALVCGGSLAASGGYAWYLRSPGYRARVAADLGEVLGLPADIGGVVPRSRSVRQFIDVRVWLPDRRDVALRCTEAAVVRRPTAQNPQAYELELNGGTCEISTRTWLREDYRHVVESGLRPGFSPDGPEEVSFAQMNLRVVRDGFEMLLNNASGTVEFRDTHVGHAVAFCHDFNGYLARDPIMLTATFSPQVDGVRVDQVELTVPRLPLRTLRLEGFIGAPVASGAFLGRLRYSETSGRQLSIAGRCFDVALEEWTGRYFPAPLHGRCDELELLEFAFEERSPTRLRFRGVVTDLVIGELLAPLGLAAVGGRTTLRVREAELSPLGIERLIATGRSDGIALEPLTAHLGLGRMSGAVQVVIGDLTIEHNRLRSLSAALRVVSDDPAPRWIEGRLLREAVKQVLAFELPPVLPERIEYSELGVRLEVQDEVLRIYGTHGAGDRTILTARLFGRDVALVSEPGDPIDLAPQFDRLRALAAAHLQERLPPLLPLGPALVPISPRLFTTTRPQQEP
jgi:hypothetical protein